MCRLAHQPGPHFATQERGCSGGELFKLRNRKLLPPLFFLALICYLDRTNVAFASLEMDEKLGLTAREYGIASGIFFVGYVAFQVPSQQVLVRVGAPKWLSALLVVWALAAAALAFAPDARTLYLLRFILGAAEAGAFPGIWFYLATWYDANELIAVYPRVTIATALSGVVGGPIAAAILKLGGAGGLDGYQWIFIIEGLVPMLFAIFMPRLLPRSPAEAPWMTPAQKRALAERLERAVAVQEAAAGQGSGASARKEKSLLQVLWSWRLWMCSLVNLLSLVANYGILFWCPQLLQRIVGEDAPVGIVAVLTAVPLGCGSVAILGNAWHASKMHERRWHSFAGFAVASIGLAATAAGLRVGRSNSSGNNSNNSKSGLWLAFSGICVAAGGNWAVQGPVMTFVAAVETGTAAANGQAVVNMVGAFGGLIGPPLIGTLVDAAGDHPDLGFADALVILCVLQLVAMPLSLLLTAPGEPFGWSLCAERRRRRPRYQRPQSVSTNDARVGGEFHRSGRGSEATAEDSDKRELLASAGV